MNDPSSQTQWEVTHSSPDRKGFSFCVKEFQQRDNHFVKQEITKNSVNEINVMLSKELIDEEIKNHEHIPVADRKSAAVATLGAKAIADTYNTLSKPENNMTHFSIRDRTNKNQEKVYNYNNDSHLKKDTSSDTIEKLGRDILSKAVDVTIESSSKLGSGAKLIATGATTLVSGLIGSAVCIKKEISNGTDIKSALMHCGGETAEEVIKDVSTSIVSSQITNKAMVLSLKTAAKFLGNFGGTTLGEIFFSDALNPDENKDPEYVRQLKEIKAAKQISIDQKPIQQKTVVLSSELKSQPVTPIKSTTGKLLTKIDATKNHQAKTPSTLLQEKNKPAFII